LRLNKDLNESNLFKHGWESNLFKRKTVAIGVKFL